MSDPDEIEQEEADYVDEPDDDDAICGQCAGSGEGMHDGSICGYCKGSGVA
jgi:hypothetical protein